MGFNSAFKGLIMTCASRNIELNHAVLVSEHQVLPPFSTML